MCLCPTARPPLSIQPQERHHIPLCLETRRRASVSELMVPRYPQVISLRSCRDPQGRLGHRGTLKHSHSPRLRVKHKEWLSGPGTVSSALPLQPTQQGRAGDKDVLHHCCQLRRRRGHEAERAGGMEKVNGGCQSLAQVERGRNGSESTIYEEQSVTEHSWAWTAFPNTAACQAPNKTQHRLTGVLPLLPPPSWAPHPQHLAGLPPPRSPGQPCPRSACPLLPSSPHAPGRSTPTACCCWFWLGGSRLLPARVV